MFKIAKTADDFKKVIGDCLSSIHLRQQKALQKSWEPDWAGFFSFLKDQTIHKEWPKLL